MNFLKREVKPPYERFTMEDLERVRLELRRETAERNAMRFLVAIVVAMMTAPIVAWVVTA